MNGKGMGEELGGLESFSPLKGVADYGKAMIVGALRRLVRFDSDSKYALDPYIGDVKLQILLINDSAGSRRVERFPCDSTYAL